MTVYCDYIDFPSEYLRITSWKVEAGAGLWGPGMEPVGAGGQTGVTACSGKLECGQPEGKDGVGMLGEGVCVEWGGQGGCRDAW